MDFKSLMSAQIAKSKSSVNGSAAASASTSKYQRRSELESKRQAEYAAEQERLEKERQERAAKKRRLEEEEAEQNLLREEKKRKLAEESEKRREAEEAEQERLRRKRLGLPEQTSTNGQPDSKDSTPPPEDQPEMLDDELRSKLRDLNQPAILYDESHDSRLKRYYKLITMSKSLSKKPKYTSGPIPTTLEPLPEKDLLLPNPTTSSPLPTKAHPEEYTYLHRQVASYITLILTEWSKALNSRTEATKSSLEGRKAYQTYTTVLSDLAPLYRKLETQTLPTDLLTPIVEITHLIQERKYVTANDTYLRLSIGKAAWPIGVTMVGIHERSAREKLHEGDGSNKAHIMADEVTRKMLQSLKRCLSFAQTRWVPEDVGELMG